MSRRVGTPVNQKRLTNVSVVKLMKGGKRFEIACYCNKVESWRKGIETDLSEVLQSEFVFTNVSKGEFANSKDLKKCFGSDDVIKVCQVILMQGELQLTAKERQAHTESTFRDIATIISEKCINPTNSRPYTVSTILSALRDDLKYGLVAGRSPKQQALDLIKRLQTVIPITRAKMHIRIHDTPLTPLLSTDLLKHGAEASPPPSSSSSSNPTQPGGGGQVGLDYFIEPDQFKVLSSLITDVHKGRIEVVQLSVADQVITENTITTDTSDEVKVTELVETMDLNDRPASIIPDDDEEDKEEGDMKKKNNKSNKRKSKGAKRREKEEAQEKAIAKQEARAKIEKRRLEKEAREIAAADDDDNSDDEAGNELNSPPPAQSSQTSTGEGGGSASKSCNTCGGSFKTAAEHRAHFKTDWHRFNLKLKMAGQPVVSEAEFAVDAEDFF